MHDLDKGDFYRQKCMPNLGVNKIIETLYFLIIIIVT